MVEFKFKKRLAQHILIDKTVLRKIIDAADLKKDDVVLEIGPGTGVLTEELAKRVKKVIAVEKDASFLETLNLKLKTFSNVEIIIGDALKFLPRLCSKFHVSGFKIVGNIPYYITGYLLRIIGELETKPSLIVLTIQKEVAERIVAQPPKMNLLAVIIQLWAKPEIAAFVPRAAFRPQPKVDSAIIKLTPLKVVKAGLPAVALAKAGFRQPRKLLINNLINSGSSTSREGLGKEDLMRIFQKLGFQDNIRAQDLSIEDWQRLVSGLTPIKVI